MYLHSNLYAITIRPTMTRSIRPLAVLVVLNLAACSDVARGDIYDPNIVGYANRVFVVGENLFANPLQASPDNALSTLFATVPEGASISLWNPAVSSFADTSTFTSGAWSIDFTLDPGTGARLITPEGFEHTFVGTVLNRDGTPFSNDEDPGPPPPFFGPDGLYLLSDVLPVTSTGSDIFLNILGRLPQVGEQVITLSATSTYLGDDNWDLVPTLGVSDAVFLNVGVVPEPTTATLGLFGLAILVIWRSAARLQMATTWILTPIRRIRGAKKAPLASTAQHSLP